MDTRYKFSPIKTIHDRLGRAYNKGIVYQISLYSIMELPNVILIVLDIVLDDNNERRSCIVYQRNKYTYMTKLEEVDKILNHILSNGSYVKYPPLKSDSLLAVCLDLMSSAL